MTQTPPTSPPDVLFNRDALGKPFGVVTHAITRELVLGFCHAIGETNPMFTNDEAASRSPNGGIVAPPCLVGSFVRAMDPPDLELQFEGTIYMAGQWIEPVLPVRVGDEITCTARLTDVYRKTGRSGDMVFIVVEHTMTNQRGEVVARAGRSHVRRR